MCFFNRWKDDEDEDRRRRLAASSQADHWWDGFQSLHEEEHSSNCKTTRIESILHWFVIKESMKKCDSNKSTGRKVRKTLIKAKKSGGRRSLKNFSPLKSPKLMRSPILPVVRPNLGSPNQSIVQKGALGALLANTLKCGSVGDQVPNQPSEQP